MNFRLSFFTSGIMLVILGAAMLLPAAIDYVDGHSNFSAFFISSLVSVFFGGALLFSNYGRFRNISVKEGFVLTSMTWLNLSLVACIPFCLSDLHLSFTDAFFESISGVTTTGSTVLSQLDIMSRGILFWRSMLQWIGGIGIIAFAMVLLPFLNVGGMQLFKTESSDRSEKIIPQSRKLVSTLVLVYVILTVLCFFTYYILGMKTFDAVNHAMTTLSTGGYSTHDASFGAFNSAALQLAASLFMLMGGLPFVLFVKFILLGKFDFLKDQQVRGFLFIVFLISVPLIGSLVIGGEYGFFDAFVSVIFNVISILTTTGFATTDYTLWGPFAVIVFFFATYLGGCAGSTAGGLKTMRVLVVFTGIRKQLNQLIYPHGVFTARYQGSPLNRGLIMSVFGFLSLYVVLNAVLTLALMLVGLDIETSLSGAATAIANVGPGIGNTIGPAGNFSSLPDSAKWLLCLGMYLGRLEILTVLVIFTPAFWSDK